MIDLEANRARNYAVVLSLLDHKKPNVFTYHSSQLYMAVCCMVGEFVIDLLED